MSVVSARLGFALGLAALCLDAGAARAQSVPYWTSGWPSPFGSNFASSFSSTPPSAFSGLDGGAGGNFSSRYNFADGWFVGNERGALGLNGLGQLSAFSSTPSFSYEGMQFGYNFKDAPVTVYAGFDTLKFNTGLASPFATFDSTPTSVSGYSARVGVEYRPTSNLSLSVGASFAQQPSGDINSALLPGASPFAFGRR
jgi:hypothetical protein